MTPNELRKQFLRSEQADRENADRIEQKNWGELRKRMETVWKELGQWPRPWAE